MIHPPSAFPVASSTGKSLEWYGTEQAALLAGGHSHALCLFLALATGATAAPAAVLRGNNVPVEDRYWDAIVATDPTLPLAISFRGNAATRHFLFEPERPFTVVHPAIPATSRDQVVPTEAVRFLVEHEAAELDTLLGRLRGRRCVLLAPPPPKNEMLVRRGLSLNTPMTSIMRKRGWDPETAPITPLELRAALHTITVAVFEEVAQRHAVPVLPIPPRAIAADGSLRPEYANDDVSHGNAALGALLWEAVAAHFDLHSAAHRPLEAGAR